MVPVYCRQRSIASGTCSYILSDLSDQSLTFQSLSRHLPPGGRKSRGSGKRAGSLSGRTDPARFLLTNRAAA
jgi:hypothetical protein